MKVEVFPAIEVRYSLDSHNLYSVRQRASLSAAAFAKLAGWSTAYQRKLEAGRVKTVSEETARTILTVLRERGIITKDVLQ